MRSFYYIDKHKMGKVKLIPEEPEDFWPLYNVVREGDFVSGIAFRKVVQEHSDGSSSSQRKKIYVTIKVVSIDYNPGEQSFRANGVNVKESDSLKKGAHQTIEVTLGHDITIEKDFWDSVTLATIRDACDIQRSAEVAAILLREGAAQLCLIKNSMTQLITTVKTQIPRKSKINEQHDKALTKFLHEVLQAVQNSFTRLDLLKCIIVGSNGFLNEKFMNFMEEMIVRHDIKSLREHKRKFLLCHCSTGHMGSLDEMLSTPSVQSQIQDTRLFSQVNALNKFMESLRNDTDMAVYGFRSVVYAHSMRALKTLMITDTLFRNNNINQRRVYVDLVEKSKAAGIDVLIFSSLHVSGQQLDQLTGIAAILHFPVPDIDDLSLTIELPSAFAQPSSSSGKHRKRTNSTSTSTSTSSSSAIHSTSPPVSSTLSSSPSSSSSSSSSSSRSGLTSSTSSADYDDDNTEDFTDSDNDEIANFSIFSF
eukprot:TRINITY_DN2049_c0_g1_i1.p1 TRINITY_DN2049_c0_g1~~TRINITY_DN2049_c0_g1_i1.p1  ORF type:complete len:505 (-),score=237.27 TRINITY_DN2049_c0_g1_i1:147-1580(-)